MFASLEAFLNELYLLKDEFFPKARFEITYSRINKVSLPLRITLQCLRGARAVRE